MKKTKSVQVGDIWYVSSIKEEVMAVSPVFGGSIVYVVGESEPNVVRVYNIRTKKIA